MTQRTRRSPLLILIGILALIMLGSVKYHVPEWFTGLSGVAFIVVSLYSSVKYRKRMVNEVRMQ